MVGMGRMTVKTSGYAMGTMVAVMFHIDGAPMVGKLAKVNRGYEIQWADGSVRLTWSAGRKVYIRTVGNDFPAEVEAWERNGVEVSESPAVVDVDPEDIRQAAREDLYNRALSLGYTDEAAYRLSDCFINWDMVPDPCVKHPNHSTAIRGGYAVDSCEACDVIKLSTDAGYTLAGWHKAQAERAAEYARIEAEHAAGTTDHPIDSLLNSGVKAPAVTNGDRFIWSEDGSEYEVVGLRNRGAQDELVIFSSGESLFMDRLKAMIIDGRMVPNVSAWTS